MKKTAAASAVAVAALGLGALAFAAPASADQLTRVSGVDRYQTAVNLAQRQTAGAQGGNVVIVSGTTFADALSAGPLAAGLDASLLLTLPDRLPDSVADYLDDTNPTAITIVGGDAAVSAEVSSELAVYTNNITRIAGSDRFETSRQVAGVMWSAGLDGDDDAEGENTAIIATGVNYPDALAAGTAGEPVVLVNGEGDGIGRETQNLFREYDVNNLFVVGGTAAVNEAVEDSARVYDNDLTRLSGDDRYQTAVAINEEFAGDTAPDNSFLVSGVNFPDALATTAYASNDGVGIVLTTPACLNSDAADYLDDADWVTVGGQDAVSDNASEQGVRCDTGDSDDNNGDDDEL